MIRDDVAPLVDDDAGPHPVDLATAAGPGAESSVAWRIRRRLFAVDIHHGGTSTANGLHQRRFARSRRRHALGNEWPAGRPERGRLQGHVSACGWTLFRVNNRWVRIRPPNGARSIVPPHTPESTNPNPPLETTRDDMHKLPSWNQVTTLRTVTALIRRPAARRRLFRGMGFSFDCVVRRVGHPQPARVWPWQFGETCPGC